MCVEDIEWSLGGCLLGCHFSFLSSLLQSKGDVEACAIQSTLMPWHEWQVYTLWPETQEGTQRGAFWSVGVTEASRERGNQGG